ncbi:LolA-like outer membrane lipoprotein chaperone [Sulfurovum sp.]|uniref:LolA-like outer membrane lipoprotein chaperone n=1 Tax=Sulfurovum sp. TaxID=1969726 RepID=UPI002868123F|nr:LolA-like outer membrane lipoprotein chaperone [Sulfurovum sp.]
MRLLSLLLLLSSVLFSSIALPENFQADFEQKITNTKNKVIKYEGKVLFSDKNLFKWSYVSPTKKEVCSDGVELLVVDHDLEQVSTFYITKELDISKVLNKAKLHSRNIYVAEYEGKNYTIQLDNTEKLHSIAYYDELDNKVQIIFTKMNYGKGKLASHKMKCNYPNVYDMIRG